jgi:hypothetical protein
LLQFGFRPDTRGGRPFAQARVPDLPEILRDVKEIKDAGGLGKQFSDRFVNPRRAISQHDDLVVGADARRAGDGYVQDEGFEARDFQHGGSDKMNFTLRISRECCANKVWVKLQAFESFLNSLLLHRIPRIYATAMA